VDRSQCSGSGALLCLVGAAAVGALRAGQDTARSDEDDLTVRELLLEFASEALLNLVEAGEERNWDEDHDSFFCGNVDLRGVG
jgi:hypothetical protein